MNEFFYFIFFCRRLTHFWVQSQPASALLSSLVRTSAAPVATLTGSLASATLAPWPSAHNCHVTGDSLPTLPFSALPLRTLSAAAAVDTATVGVDATLRLALLPPVWQTPQTKQPAHVVCLDDEDDAKEGKSEKLPPHGDAQRLQRASWSPALQTVYQQHYEVSQTSAAIQVCHMCFFFLIF
jgi:hypothetical protein